VRRSRNGYLAAEVSFEWENNVGILVQFTMLDQKARTYSRSGDDVDSKKHTPYVAALFESDLKGFAEKMGIDRRDLTDRIESILGKFMDERKQRLKRKAESEKKRVAEGQQKK